MAEDINVTYIAKFCASMTIYFFLTMILSSESKETYSAKYSS